jgi:hypothetical protein
MSSQQTPPPSPTLMSTVAQLFSPATLAAVRYTLTAVSPVLAIFGFAALTPDQIDHFINYAKTFGVAAGAISALVGILVPTAALIFGVLSSTWKKQVARFKQLSKDPSAAGEEAAKAIIEATGAIAQSPGSQSKNAVQTLIATTVALPEVQTIVTDQATADAAPSENVVAAKS